MLYKARKKKMLSKEEYLTHLDYGVKTCPAIRDAFKELINEHFKPKENTSEFKHFKLHSDSSLKNLTKNELIDYIKMLYHNWGACDEQLKNCIDKAKELSDSNDELRRQLYFIEPYKFEDLKVGMWVYDIKYDEFCRIDFIAGIYPHRSYSDGTCEDGAFEENRFFPVQYANWNGSER